MKKNLKAITGTLLASSLALGVLSSPLVKVHAESVENPPAAQEDSNEVAPASTSKSTVQLRIMETTDIHTNLVNYDYYKDTETFEYGLALTASLIKQARAEAKNSLLIDNGDLIQGNSLGDYVAKIKPLKDGETHPVYKAMNLMGYDVGNIGNHEFNYGLNFLDRSLKGAKFPYVNANVYIDDHDHNDKNDANRWKPYTILTKEVEDEKGKKTKIKIGVIGFVPPQIMQWDKDNLQGKIITKDMVETAEKFIPKMKKEGADIIIAVPHSGIDMVRSEGQENAVYQLTKVPGIDAVLFGHAHKLFPSAQPDKDGFVGDNIDNKKGTINGIPAVEPGFWGNNLGVIDLTLQKKGSKWVVRDSQSTNLSVYKKDDKGVAIKENGQFVPVVQPDKQMLSAVSSAHKGTLKYVRGPVGETTAPINSYFALAQDDPSVQIVSDAQTWYVKQQLQGTDYEKYPVLSAAAPFKAGGRQGATYYTDIPAGTIAIKNVADLYLYPNTVKATLINGAELKEWLEWSAGQFNQINPSSTAEQPLVDTKFPTYNFDIIDGVTYQIDVTQPAKYDAGGKVINENSNRIKNLSFEGKLVDPKQKFVVATNNYRAGGAFANPDKNNIILDAPLENRQAIIEYITEKKKINPSADNNWTFAPISGNVNVTFDSSPNGAKFLGKDSKISLVGPSSDGFSKYTINMSK
ncbi:bifunctional 2',3'-cyclic-nucleotide 2'-phosphodiesterase/3'-nucleotidase [Brevibacillus ginsengisoli]|uniref:bifunctional 2',3'-cyclic-nucleotide 2'-phosphodiesterase/3'-nucleotidase n=1 Tax=Brevibacillus ginsengisoli TaxID=363854 RepID=UPI003CE86E40